jgi:hypothetical protein
VVNVVPHRLRSHVEVPYLDLDVAASPLLFLDFVDVDDPPGSRAWVGKPGIGKRGLALPLVVP